MLTDHLVVRFYHFQIVDTVTNPGTAASPRIVVGIFNS
jgi:hypothetical protein